MARLTDQVIGDAYRNSIAWETLESLVDVENRMAGQDGERVGAETLADVFETVGLRDVTLDTFEIPGWWRGSSSLELNGRGSRYDHSHQVIALPGTPAAEERAELVDVGHGTPAEFEAVDVEDKLVMASSKIPDDYDRWLHRKEKYESAVEGGAVGFVFRNHVEGCLPPTGGIGEDGGAGPIPAVGVSRELGHRLVRHCEDDTVQATLSIDCRNEQTTSQNVSGVVGPDTDERILVTAHCDAHDIAEGAKDNGAGSALVAEVGRQLTALEDELDVSVECLVFGAEEVGLRGSTYAAENRTLDNIRAVVNLDAIGSSREMAVQTHGFEALADAFETVSEGLATPIEVKDEVAPHSDHWPFVKRGVPGLMAYSASDSQGRGYGHTHADTLDKLDRRDFRDLALQVSAGVLAIAERDTEHVDPETIEQRAEDEGYDID